MASASQIAAVLLRAAAKCESFRPAALLEIAGFSSGVKRSVRLVLSEADSAVLLSAAADLHIAAAVSSVFIQDVGPGWSSLVGHQTDNRAALLVLSHDDPEKLLSAELSDSKLAGALLGYPACCIDAMTRMASAADRWPFLLTSEIIPGVRIDARLNRFAAEWGGVGLIGELFPCVFRRGIRTPFSG
jgi:hypothetical protein